MQEDDASHQLLHIVVIDGTRLALTRQLCHNAVVVDMVLVEELFTEGFDRKGLKNICDTEVAAFPA